MPTPTKGKRLGGSPAHEKAILANLATALFEHGSITTTETKARRLRPFAERLITKARRGDLHARRQVMKVIRDKGIVHELFTEIGPRFQNRPGGYTRITKIGPRKGDNAPMAVIGLVEEEMPGTSAAPSQAPAASSTPADTDSANEEAPVAAEKAPAADEAPAAESGQAEAAAEADAPDDARSDQADSSDENEATDEAEQPDEKKD